MPCVTKSVLALNAMGQQLLQCLECGRFKSFTFCFTGIWSQNLTNSWNTNVFLGFFFFLPGHFLLLTTHSLISEISGQGLPKGDGYWRTCRVRVSWPRLNPQVLPDREQGLHSLHSPTSQCTKLRKRAEGEKLQCLFILC